MINVFYIYFMFHVFFYKLLIFQNIVIQEILVINKNKALFNRENLVKYYSIINVYLLTVSCVLKKKKKIVFYCGSPQFFILRGPHNPKSGVVELLLCFSTLLFHFFLLLAFQKGFSSLALNTTEIWNNDIK